MVLHCGDGTRTFLKTKYHPRLKETDVFPAIAGLASRHLPQAIAVDPEQGHLLLADHKGQNLGSAMCQEPVLRAILEIYCEIQAKAAKDSAWLARFPRRIELAGLTDSLLAFLGLRADKGEIADAASFWFSGEELTEVRSIIHGSRALLDGIFSRAATLPLTLNHCDLHEQNVARRPDDSLVITDWADALIGPAGLSMPGFMASIAVLFGGPDKTSERGFDKMAGSMYARILANLGYASITELEDALPGAALAGSVQQALNFSYFRVEDPPSKLFIKGQIQNTFSQLEEILRLERAALS